MELLYFGVLEAEGAGMSLLACWSKTGRLCVSQTFSNLFPALES